MGNRLKFKSGAVLPCLKCRFVAFILGLAVLFSSCSGGSAENTSGNEGMDETMTGNMEIITTVYPQEAVREITVAEAGEICRNVTTETDPSLNKGLSGAGIYVSPYYTLKVNDTEVPVYCTPVYTPSVSGSGGVLHSFARIEVKGNMSKALSVALSATEALSVKMAVVAPQSYQVTPTVEENTVFAEINGCGHYTFLVNGEDQRYAFTLSVSEYTDEESEIAALQEKYPEKKYDGVTVFEPGVHYVDPMIFNGASGKVIYLKRGALLIARHMYDLDTPEDSQTWSRDNCPEEDDGCGGLGIGLPRRAVIGAVNSAGIVIAGHGTIDFSMLDLAERNGIAVTYSRDVEMRDITLINSAAWTITVYNCDNVSIRNVVTYSWRVSSDSFDLCNSRQVLVEDCFSRGGDDIYVVKTLGGAPTAVAENITVRNCIAWAGKARAFSIASEVCKDIRNILFEDCSVVLHDSVWNRDYVSSLAVVLESMEEETVLENVVFRNLEIFRELGRSILVNVYTPDAEDCRADILFENISVGAGKGAGDMKFNAANDKNDIAAVLKQVTVNNTVLTSENLTERAEILGGAVVTIP